MCPESNYKGRHASLRNVDHNTHCLSEFELSYRVSDIPCNDCGFLVWITQKFLTKICSCIGFGDITGFTVALLPCGVMIREGGLWTQWRHWFCDEGRTQATMRTRTQAIHSNGDPPRCKLARTCPFVDLSWICCFDISKPRFSSATVCFETALCCFGRCDCCYCCCLVHNVF